MNAPTSRRARLVRAVVPATLAVAVLAGAYVLGARSGDDDRGSGVDISSATDATVFDHDFLIPEGTAERIADGEQIEIVPAELVVEVGDTLRIVNEDTSDHVVGVFFVAAGETLTQRFNSEAVLEGECSVHPSGAFTLRIVPDADDT